MQREKRTAWQTRLNSIDSLTDLTIIGVNLKGFQNSIFYARNN